MLRDAVEYERPDAQGDCPRDLASPATHLGMGGAAQRSPECTVHGHGVLTPKPRRGGPTEETVNEAEGHKGGRASLCNTNM